jgi:hypothetical protein
MIAETGHDTGNYHMLRRAGWRFADVARVAKITCCKR